MPINDNCHHVKFPDGLPLDDLLFVPDLNIRLSVKLPGTSWSKWTRLVQGMRYYYENDLKEFDGVYGTECKAAVKAFQKANGIIQDGEAGPNTFANFYA